MGQCFLSKHDANNESGQGRISFLSEHFGTDHVCELAECYQLLVSIFRLVIASPLVAAFYTIMFAR